jgi:hypothetical protein
MNPHEPEKKFSASGLPQPLCFPVWVHGFVWSTMLALVLLLAGICHAYQGRNIWNGWTECAEFRKPIYAERVYPEDVFRTRVNTWSNLAYVVVGLYALALGCHDWRRKPANADGYLIRTPAMSLLFGTMCCALGFGSGLFHASLTRWGQQLDVAAMYSPLVALIAINLGRRWPRLKTSSGQKDFPTWPLLTGLALVTSFLLYYYKWSLRTGLVMLILILSVSGFGLLDLLRPRSRLAIRWLVISGVALVAAHICWRLDVAGKFSGPDTWLQGHSVWHLLTGLSLAGIYLFYRSEAVQPDPCR